MRVRWLGRVAYVEAWDLQRALATRSTEEYLLLLEHPSVFTLGRNAVEANVLVDPASVGAEAVRVDRGGDVTYHGPGQLIGYPIRSVGPGPHTGTAHVHQVEQVVIDALVALGLSPSDVGRLPGFPGVWVGLGPTAQDRPPGPRKICAIGVRSARGRTTHGFALNVHTDLTMFDHIVPCGIRDRGVTSMAALLGAAPEMRDVVDGIVAQFTARFTTRGAGTVERQDVVWREHPDDLSAFSRAAMLGTATRPGDAPVRLLGRLAEAGVTEAVDEPGTRRPEWMRVRADLGANFRETKRLVQQLELHTVCEEAGCPNIYECWADHTATFMILGDRCTRACGFCLVDTRKPLPLDPDEPRRVADAVTKLGLEHAVITSVARDDLPDGGAAGFAATIAAVRGLSPTTRIEVLIPDCKGDPAALDALFAARPDVLNHNLETVARLHRAARPSAAYFRSLALLARAADAGLLTKSGIILGMGETADEVRGAIADLRNVGVDVLTLGQYLRPSRQHLPVARWWTPEEFAELGAYAEGLGFGHVEAGPLVRSSYHAKRARTAATPAGV
jgi:lipoyl synthase